MKIIRKGNPKACIPPEYGIYICHHCDCKFEVEINDERPAEYALHGYTKTYACLCPNCRKLAFKEV
jgi:hypothetical protein